MKKPDEEVQRVSDALREAIRRRKTSQRQIERALGQGKGYLSQLLGGNVDLKLKHIFAVLEVLEQEPEDFFLGIYGRSDPVGAVRGMVAQSQTHREIEEIKSRLSRLEKKAGLEPEHKSKPWP